MGSVLTKLDATNFDTFFHDENPEEAFDIFIKYCEGGEKVNRVKLQYVSRFKTSYQP